MGLSQADGINANSHHLGLVYALVLILPNFTEVEQIWLKLYLAEVKFG